MIEAHNGKSLTGYTRYSGENEVLLMPDTKLRVVSNALSHESGLHIVHLQGIFPEQPALPIQVNSISSSIFVDFFIIFFHPSYILSGIQLAKTFSRFFYYHMYKALFWQKMRFVSVAMQ